MFLVSCPYASPNGLGTVYAAAASGQCTYTGYFNSAYNFACNGVSAGLQTVTCNVAPSETSCERHDPISVFVFDDILAPQISAPSTYGSCGSGKCLQKGGVTYFGGHVPSSISRDFSGYRSLVEILPNFARYKEAVRLHFRDIRNTFHVRMIRIPVFANNGTMNYPIPTSTQLNGLNQLIDLASEEGLSVYLLIQPVFDLTENYDPETMDSFHTKNGKTLWQNHSDFFGTIVYSIGAQRFKSKIEYIDILGDFNPFRGTETQQKSRQAWFRKIWLYASYGYQGILPQEKLTFEINGDAADPLHPDTGLPAQIIWAKRNLKEYGLPLPQKYGIELYTSRAWVNLNYQGDYFEAMQVLIDRAAQAIAGNANDLNNNIVVDNAYNRLIVVEAGSSKRSYPGETNFSGHDSDAIFATDDGQNGQAYYKSLFQAALNRSSGIPIIIFHYADGAVIADGRWGIRNPDNTLGGGAWVLPQYFAY